MEINISLWNAIVTPPAHPDGVKERISVEAALEVLRRLPNAGVVELPYAFVMHPDDAVGCKVEAYAIRQELLRALEEAADAELFTAVCPSCGHTWVTIACDRATGEECPSCGIYIPKLRGAPFAFIIGPRVIANDGSVVDLLALKRLLSEELSPESAWRLACELRGLKAEVQWMFYNSAQFRAIDPETGEVVASHEVG